MCPAREGTDPPAEGISPMRILCNAASGPIAGLYETTDGCRRNVVGWIGINSDHGREAAVAGIVTK